MSTAVFYTSLIFYNCPRWMSVSWFLVCLSAWILLPLGAVYGQTFVKLFGVSFVGGLVYTVICVAVALIVQARKESRNK